VIGQFPWDPFPAGEPDPKGPDPIHSLAYRAAVTAADAYHAVRVVVRREAGTLRIGNRFVPEGRYREVGFLAFGNAANSMALGALHALGDRLTQGYLTVPDAVAPEVPFRGIAVPPGWPGSASAAQVTQAAEELAGELGEQDLLLVLLSPGALRALAAPPPGMSPEDFARFLERAGDLGATGREVGLLARVLGTGSVGGRLARAIPRADIVTLVVDRGDGPGVLGGGPMRPVPKEERVEARGIVDRLGLLPALPASAVPALAPDSSAPLSSRAARPVVIATPADALRAASDALFDKGWTSRLAFLELTDRPDAAAERFLARAEEVYRGEPLTTESRTRGLAAFAMTTLGLPEGLDEGPALGQFLQRSQHLLNRREMSVGLFRTGGSLSAPPATSPPAFPPGAVVGAPTDPDAKVAPGHARAVRMNPGITDVGCLAIALYPRPGSN
jgi:glycerate-2-kinase